MIVVICGPTGTGKSSFAIKLAKAIDGEIINGDAFQVYKHLNIATAKPSEEAFKEVPHHLYDISEVYEDYTVAHYQKDARIAIDNVRKRGKTPIIVGGSGLYIRATLYDYEFSEMPKVDLSEYKSKTNSELHNYLSEIDKESANKIHPNNRKRLLRAIEIYLATGESKSAIEAKQKQELIEEAHFFALDIDRKLLYEHLDERVNKMVEAGLFEEVENLLKKHPHNARAFEAIGYKQVVQGKQCNLTKAEIIADIQKATRNYAKRQIAYFKHQLPTIWVKSWDEVANILEDLYDGRKN